MKKNQKKNLKKNLHLSYKDRCIMCDKYFCHYKCSFLRNHIHLDPVRHLPVLLFVHPDP